jgi:hypothetical protein
MPGLRAAAPQQKHWDKHNPDAVRASSGAEPSVEPVFVSDQRPEDVAAHVRLADRGRVSPELLYLETKWASMTLFAKVADLLKEVLPVGASTNHETVREHLQVTAERMEQELGEELQPNLYDFEYPENGVVSAVEGQFR